MEGNMTSEQLAAIAGVILSLSFSYIPKLSDWFHALEPTMKRLIMAGLLLAVAAGAYGLSCGAVITAVTCDKSGAMGLVMAFIAALVANQAAFAISPRKAIAVLK